MGFFIYLFIILVLYSNGILAGPIDRRSKNLPFHLFNISLTHNHLTAISTQLLNTFVLYEQYAAAAYCPENNDSPNTKIFCTSDSCPLVQAADTNTVVEFQK
jgi:hypothetical protein